MFRTDFFASIECTLCWSSCYARLDQLGAVYNRHYGTVSIDSVNCIHVIHFHGGWRKCPNIVTMRPCVDLKRLCIIFLGQFLGRWWSRSIQGASEGGGSHRQTVSLKQEFFLIRWETSCLIYAGAFITLQHLQEHFYNIVRIFHIISIMAEYISNVYKFGWISTLIFRF